MKKNKIKRFPFLLVFTVCIVSAFAFLMAITNSNITNLIATDPNTEFNITYDLKDGKFTENITAPTKYKYIEETSIPNPVKDGSEFLGWTINDKEGEPVKDYKIPKSTSGDIKLTANWEVKGSMLYDGITFNETIYSLLMNIDGYSPSNDLSIKFIKGIPLDVNSYPNTLVGDGVIAYFKNGVLYVASDNIIYANRDCSSMFDLIYYRTGGVNRTPKTLIDHIRDHTSGFVGHLPIKSIEFNNFNTVNVTNMEGMFRHCSSLVKLDLTGFNLDNVSNYNYMFENCSNLSSKITITNNLDMSFSDYINMFKGCSTDSNSKFYVDYSKDKVLLYDVVRFMIKTKSENSNVFLYETEKLVDGTTFNNIINLYDAWETGYPLSKLIFRSGNVPENAENITDVSEAQDGSIKLYTLDSRITQNTKALPPHNNIYITSNKIIQFNEDCSGMFENIGLSNIDFSNIDTSNIKNMENMFKNSFMAFTLNLSDWDIKNVTNMNNMFNGSQKLGGEITIMSSPTYENMFANCDAGNYHSDNFIIKYIDDTTKEVARKMVATKPEGETVFLDGTQPATLVDGNTFFKVIYSKFGYYTDLKNIIFDYGTPDTEINDVNDLSEKQDKSILGYKKGDTYYVVSENEIMANSDCSSMFGSSRLIPMGRASSTIQVENITFNNFNTSNVTNMYEMFYGCYALKGLDVSNWSINDNRGSIRTDSMFENCTNLKEIKGIQILIDIAINGMNCDSMFKNCSNLSGEITIETDREIDNIYYYQIFTGCSTDPSAKIIVNYSNKGYSKEVAEYFVGTKSEKSNIILQAPPATLMDGRTFNSTILGMSGFDNVTEIRFIKGTPNPNGVNVAIDGIAKAYISGSVLTVASEGEIFANPNSSYMFEKFGYKYGGINSILNKITFNNFKTDKVTDMNHMFYWCSSLTSLDVSNFDTSNVEDMSYIFYGCISLTSLDVSNFNTSKVTDMTDMFGSCGLLKNIDVSNFNTSNVTNMESMFIYCNSLTSITGIESFNTSKVTDMSNMFDGCRLLTSLDVSNFDTSKVTDMRGMFASCTSQKNIDVSNFDTSNVTNMESMFSMADFSNNLTSIKGIENFDTSKVTKMCSMFKGCKKISGSITISNPNVEYNDRFNNHIFENCSTVYGSKFIVNYSYNCKTIATEIVNSKVSASNIVLGTEILPPQHSGGTGKDITNKEEPSVPDTVVLAIKDGSTTTIKEILAGEIGSLNVPSKEGMIFSGYFYDAEFTKPVSERDVISEDITVYIKWEEVPQVEEIPYEENKDESLEVA